MKLADLIRDRKKRLGISYAQMAETARDAGYPVSSSMFHEYETESLTNIPRTNTIYGVAAGLQIDPDTVLSACAESVGIRHLDYQKGHRTAGMIALLADRTPEQVATLEGVVRSVIRALDAAPDEDGPDTDTPGPALA